MSEQPRLTVDNYGTFAEEYDNYFNDQLPFRNNLIKLNSWIDYFVFDRSVNSKVIIGKDNWLFYDNKDDGDPIGCYQGNNLYTEAELQEIAENTSLHCPGTDACLHTASSHIIPMPEKPA